MEESLEERSLQFLGKDAFKVTNYELNHLKLVVNKIKSYGLQNQNLFAATLLSLTIHNKQASHKMLKDFFNKQVADIVYDLTPELGKSLQESLVKTTEKIKKNNNAKVITLCSHICKLKATNTSSYIYTMYVNSSKHFIKEIVTTQEPPIIQKMGEDLKLIINFKS